MITSLPSSLEYGVGGDYAGARRGRRAFRFAVATCFALTFALWFSERYLRYDRNETQYRMALTLDDPSARAILRNVVKRDAEENETPQARYLEALAAIEEDDLVLARYEEAHRINPNDSFLLINYGCRLFLKGYYREARERFREAGIQPPANALPHYLEAAALAAETGDGDLSEAIALVTRANNSGERIRFPQPLWHPSMPRQGAWHVYLQQRMAERTAAPLQRLHAIAMTRAVEDIAAGHYHTWDSWLDALQVMGQRLLEPPDSGEVSGMSRALTGIEMQLSLLSLRQQLHEERTGEAHRPFLEQKAALRHALEELHQFEARRAEEYPLRREAHLLPLRLASWAFLAFTAAYLLSMIISRMMDPRRITWALPHSGLGRVLLGVGLACGLLLLMLFGIAQNVQAPYYGAYPLLTRLWQAWLMLMLLFGLVYPALRLPPAERVTERMELEEEAGEVVRELHRHRRMAYAGLARRYYGILLGGFLCVVCFWVVAFRVNESLYPVQLRLLVSGLEQEERALLHAIRQNLQ